jgi:hypothetical protein
MAAISFVGRCRLRVGATGASAFMGRRGVGRDPTILFAVFSVLSSTNQLRRWHPEKSVLREMGGTNYDDTCSIRMRTRAYVVN